MKLGNAARIMWSSQSPEPGALSLFIGGLDSVPCEGLVPRSNPWQNKASETMALCFGWLFLGIGFMKPSGARGC